MLLTDVPASGSISAVNANPNTGAASANSTVIIDTRGMSTLTIQVTASTTSSALTPQATLSSSGDATANWITLSSTGLLNVNTGAYAATIAAATTGIWQIDVSGYSFFRLSALAAITGTAALLMRASATGGMFALDAPIPAGANAIGGVTATPATASANTLNAAASTNATSVKATAGRVYSLGLTNFSAAPKFVKLYNKASAPTVGTDVPLDTIEIAANSHRQLEYGAIGLPFTTGIAFAITGAQADSDTTALAAGDVKLHMGYL
jgi:hypothetical protein